MRPARLFGLAILGLAAASVTRARADEPYDPYKVPREQFRAQVSKIALRPLVLPHDVPNREQTRSGFEERIAQELTKRGYGVVPSSEYRDTWQHFAKDLGGVYDPVTGVADDEKHKVVWSYTLRELERKLDVDAVLVPTIRSDFMPTYTEGNWIWTPWTAAFQRLYWRGELLRGGWPVMPQRVVGQYLGVSIFDRSQVLLYGVRAPIQWSHIFLDRGYEEIPASQLYRDEQRNQQSVEAAFASLEKRGGPAPEPGAPSD